MPDESQPRTLSHYRVISQLGRGGMGEVYLAEDTRLHRRVAVKVLQPWSLTLTGYLAGMLTLAGSTSSATSVLETLGDGTAYGAPLGLVAYYLMRSEIDVAADHAEKAIAQRQPMVTAFMRMPLAKALRASPRWPALEKLMNLSDPEP